MRKVELFVALDRGSRLAVGDVTRCSAFEFGFQVLRRKQIAVSWQAHHPEYHAQSGHGYMRMIGRAEYFESSTIVQLLPSITDLYLLPINDSAF